MNVRDQSRKAAEINVLLHSEAKGVPHLIPLPVPHLDGLEAPLERLIQPFLKKNAGRAQKNDLKIKFISGILIPFLLDLFAPAFYLLHLVDYEDVLIVAVEVHLHPDLMPMVRNPSGIEAVYAIGGKVVIRHVNTVAELIYKGGFTHLARAHDNLHTPPRLGHPAL